RWGARGAGGAAVGSTPGDQRALPWDRKGASSWDLSYRRGDRLRPLVAPAGQARRPGSGATAGADDQDVVRLLEEIAPHRLVGGRRAAGPGPRPTEVG